MECYPPHTHTFYKASRRSGVYGVRRQNLLGRAENLARRVWRNHTNVGIPNRSLGPYEGPKNFCLASITNGVATSGHSDCN